MRLRLRDDGSLLTGADLPGRGAWLCADSLDTCGAQALRRGAFARAFRRPVERSAVEECLAALAETGEQEPGLAT